MSPATFTPNPSEMSRPQGRRRNALDDPSGADGLRFLDVLNRVLDGVALTPGDLEGVLRVAVGQTFLPPSGSPNRRSKTTGSKAGKAGIQKASAVSLAALLAPAFYGLPVVLERLSRLEVVCQHVQTTVPTSGGTAEGAVYRSRVVSNGCEWMPPGQVSQVGTGYSYARQPHEPAYRVLDREALDGEIEQFLAQNAFGDSAPQATFALLGGLESRLCIPGLEKPMALPSWCALLAYCREHLPSQTVLEALSPEGIEFLSIVSDRSSRYVLEALKDHGLTRLGCWTGMPLVEPVRSGLSPKSASAKVWCDIVLEAFAQGIAVTLPVPMGTGVSEKTLALHLGGLVQLVTHANNTIFKDQSWLVAPYVLQWMPLPLAGAVDMASQQATLREDSRHKTSGSGVFVCAHATLMQLAGTLYWQSQHQFGPMALQLPKAMASPVVYPALPVLHWANEKPSSWEGQLQQVKSAFEALHHSGLSGEMPAVNVSRSLSMQAFLLGQTELPDTTARLDAAQSMLAVQ